MKRDQPTTPDEWLDEMRLAIADAREAGPFGDLTGQSAARIAPRRTEHGPRRPDVPGRGLRADHSGHADRQARGDVASEEDRL